MRQYVTVKVIQMWRDLYRMSDSDSDDCISISFIKKLPVKEGPTSRSDMLALQVNASLIISPLIRVHYTHLYSLFKPYPSHLVDKY